MTVATWERWTNWPLVIAAVAFLAGYAAPIIWPSMSALAMTWCQFVVWLT